MCVIDYHTFMISVKIKQNHVVKTRVRHLRQPRFILNAHAPDTNRKNLTLQSVLLFAFKQ